MSQRTGSIGGATFTVDINDETGEVTNVSIENRTKRKCKLVIGAVQTDSERDESKTIPIQKGDRVALEDKEVTKRDGGRRNVKQFSYWFGFV